MHSKLSPHNRPIIFERYCNYNRTRIFFEMAFFSSFIVTFITFSQILAPLEAATVPSSRNSGVVWVTNELRPVENTLGQDSNPVQTTLENMAKKLLHILNEMKAFIEVMPADDPNTGADDQQYQGGLGGLPCSSDQQREETKLRYLGWYLGKLENFTHMGKDQLPTKSVEYSTYVSTQQAEALNQILKKVEERRELPEFLGQRKMVSLYPDCDNSNIWGTGNTIDFSFDLSFSIPSPEIVINVTSAFVRMYKKPLNTSLAEAMQLAPNRNISFLAVYYKNPLNKRDPTKKGFKLVEHTLQVNEERWTEWDVQKAISAGFNHTSRNNGVTIKVADDQIHLPAREFFSMPINCSHITDWPQLTPAILRKSKHEGMRQDLPFIDMIVLELPRRDVMFTEKEEEFLNGVKMMKQQIEVDENITTTNSSTEHKIRHRKNRESE